MGDGTTLWRATGHPQDYLFVKRQEQGWKGDKSRTGRGDLVEQVAKVNDE
jgi:hypothetical protein